MKTVEQASQQILETFSPLGEERLPLLAALGRFVSQPVQARMDWPEFDNSAMDGYAVRAAELVQASDEQPVRLPVHGESRAGGPPPAELAANMAMRIFTGAPIPPGADAVVLQEDTARDGGFAEFHAPTRVGHNVRARGSDFREGTLLLDRHALIGAGELALLASQGMPSVRVFRRPRVAILCTGDELRDIGEPARAGSVINSNAYGLAAQVLEAGGEPIVLPSVGDLRPQAEQAIREGLGADVLVLSGGVSVGEYDVVRDALRDAGVQLEFWKIAMKPGKPVAFGRAGRVPVLGLPGNPVSAWVTFELFVRPGLRKMLGALRVDRPRLSVRLSRPLQRKPGRTEFARGRFVRSERGTQVELLNQQGSGAMSSLAGVDVLVVLPGACTQVEPQDTLEALELRPFHG